MEVYDAFFLDTDSAKWVYHNPDATSGSQFVEIVMPYDEVVEMVQTPANTIIAKIANTARTKMLALLI